MEINVSLTNRRKDFNANGVFSEDFFVVKKGSVIRLDFAEHIRGGKKAKSYRNNSLFVDEDGNVLIDCSFRSPSTAAQFVTGRSTNGYVAWRVDEKTTLGKFLGRSK